MDQLVHLYSMSLNGNPIEAIKGYRMYVLGIMYKRCETLKKLDSTVITGTEFDNMVVWNQRLFTEDLSKLSRVSKKYYEKVGMRIQEPKLREEDGEAMK